MKRTLLLLCVLLMSVGVFADINAPAADSVNIRRLDSLPYFGNAFDVFISGDYAYVAFTTVLSIFDISDSTAPVLLGYYNTKTGYNLGSVYIDGNYAYCTADYGGVYIIDISDPAAPSYVNLFSTGDHARDVVVEGNYAYIANAASGLRIYNISNPASPASVGIYDDGTSAWANGICKDGNYVYIAYEDELYIVDVSTPSSPAYAGKADNSSSASSMSVEVVDTFAFTANYANGPWTNGLTIYNVSDKANPTVISNADTYGYSRSLAIEGNRCIVGDQALVAIDITDPANPVFGDSMFVYTESPLYGVKIAGNKLISADYYNGIKIFDISDIYNIGEFGAFYASGFAAAMIGKGDYIYLACGNGGLKVLNAADSTNVYQVFSRRSQNAQGLTIVGDTLYVADRSEGLQFFDISVPDAPVLINTHYIGLANDVFIVDTLAYVATMFGGCDIYNVKDFSSVSLVHAFTTSWTYTCCVSGDYAYLADGNNGLFIYDISDPASPDSITVITPGGEVFDVVVYDTLAFIAAGDAGVFKYNIAAPASPVFMDSYDTDGTAVDVDYDPSNNYLYVADNDGGVVILDFSSSKAPVLIGKFWDHYHGNYIYVYRDGLTIFHVVVEAEGYETFEVDKTITGINYRHISIIKDNLFLNDDMLQYSISQFGNVHLNLYDASGRKIRSIVNANKAPGDYSVKIDKTGLSSGTYFINGSIGSSPAAQKMLIIK